MKKPGIDLSECTLCESCVAVCPAVFFINDTGMIEVAELDIYPEADVERSNQILSGGLYFLGNGLNREGL